VKAPIAGTVTQVGISKSDFVERGFPAVSITNTDHLHLEIEVFERDAMKVKIGQKIIFRMSETEKTDYKAEVFLINKNIQEKKRTLNIHGHFSDEYDLLPGMFAQVQIITD